MNDTDHGEVEWAGFWVRVGASLIDTILLLLIITPLLTSIYGVTYWLNDAWVKGVWDFVLSYLFPAVAALVFWIYKSATPGKMALGLTIVDARTGARPSTGQFIGRYLGYYVSAIPLCLGFIWVAFDRRKQGWHDKLAGTVVIRSRQSEPVRFEGSPR